MKRWIPHPDGEVSTNYDLPTYLSMIRHSPWQAAKEIGSCLLILAMLAGAIWFKDVVHWIEGLM